MNADLKSSPNKLASEAKSMEEIKKLGSVPGSTLRVIFANLVVFAVDCFQMLFTAKYAKSRKGSQRNFPGHDRAELAERYLLVLSLSDSRLSAFIRGEILN